MLSGEGLVLELGSVDGLAASAISSCEITTLYLAMSALVFGLTNAISANLDHKLLDHAVEGRALVVQRLARLAQSLLASAESTEVLNGLGNEIRVQLHVDAAKRLAAQGDVEEDTGPGGLGLGFRSHDGDGRGEKRKRSSRRGAVDGGRDQLDRWRVE